MFRNILIKILFRLIDVPYNTKKALLEEDISLFSEDAEAKSLASALKMKYVLCKAEVFANEDYVEFLYYTLREHERLVCLELNKQKRDAYRGVILFLLKHIRSLNDSFNKLDNISPQAKVELKRKINKAKKTLINS